MYGRVAMVQRPIGWRAVGQPNGRHWRVGWRGLVGVVALTFFPLLVLPHGAGFAADPVIRTSGTPNGIIGEGFASDTVLQVSVDNGLTSALVFDDVLTEIGTDGKVCIYTSSTTEMVADVLGYVPDGGSPASLVPILRATLLDTRPGYMTVDGLFQGIGTRPAESTVELVVAGRGGVPADADGAMLSIAAVSPAAPGYLAVYPCGGTLPTTSFGEFTSLTPARILDTRDGTGRGGLTAPLGANETIDVQITDRGGVAASGVVAVVLNATVTAPTQPSFLTVWPAGIARPEISNLNYQPGQSVPNLVTVAVGMDGKISAYNLAGSTHVIFDVVGFYAGAVGAAGSRFHAIDPYRYFDTRLGTGGITAQPIGPNGTLNFNVLGKGGVPAAGVTGVVMNVTVTQPTTPSYLTVYPDDVASPPLASNLNYTAGQTVPNLVTVRVPASGIIDFYNLAGYVHVIADVIGYYDGDKNTEAGRFVPLSPSRTVDTRMDGRPLGPNEYFWLDMPGWNGIPSTGAGAVVINTTVTQPTAPSYLTVFPDDLCSIPLASNLNYLPGQTVPNLVIVRLSIMQGCANAAGAIDFYNSAGTVHVIADVFGYFTAAAI